MYDSVGFADLFVQLGSCEECGARAGVPCQRGCPVAGDYDADPKEQRMVQAEAEFEAMVRGDRN